MDACNIIILRLMQQMMLWNPGSRCEASFPWVGIRIPTKKIKAAPATPRNMFFFWIPEKWYNGALETRELLIKDMVILSIHVRF